MTVKIFYIYSNKLLSDKSIGLERKNTLENHTFCILSFLEIQRYEKLLWSGRTWMRCNTLFPLWFPPFVKLTPFSTHYHNGLNKFWGYILIFMWLHFYDEYFFHFYKVHRGLRIFCRGPIIDFLVTKLILSISYRG